MASSIGAELAATELLQGTFSIACRGTESEIQVLRKTVDDSALPVPAEPGDSPKAPTGGHAASQDTHSRPAKRPKGTSGKNARHEGDGKATHDGQEPQGELAKAVNERLRLKAQLKLAAADSQNGQGASGPGSPQNFPSAAFSAQGIDDGPWSSKFTASMSKGALNRWKGEERPDPGWYKVQFGLVQPRVPTADIGDHSTTKSRGFGGGHDHDRDIDDVFLTGVDGFGFLDEKQVSRYTATTTMPSTELPSTTFTDDSRFRASAMSLATGRGSLAKIGRKHVLMHEVSCPAEDALQQDVKGQHKLRAPAWDFAKLASRPPLMRNSEDVSAPGKYDVLWGNGVTSVAPRTGIAFDKGLSRAASMGQLGHGAPAAVLMPEHVRNPGRVVAPDRSSAKDSVRRRVTHVNDFAADLGRPDNTVGCQEFHDTSDPAICAEVLRRQLSFDPDHADRAVRARTIVRTFRGMTERGRPAVQGVRALQDDAHILRAAGVGVHEPSSPSAAEAATAPRGGGAAAERSGKSDWKQRSERRDSPLKRRVAPAVGAAAYQRQAPAKGFCARAPKAVVGGGAAAGPAAPQRARARSFAALPGWGSEALRE